MLDKQSFCKIINSIKEQQDIDDKVSSALELVCDGFVIYGGKTKYLDCLLQLLKITMNDEYDYIQWYLYETNDFCVYDVETKEKWILDTPESLYDYLNKENN